MINRSALIQLISELKKISAKDVLPLDTVSVEIDTPLVRVANLLLTKGINGIPVLDGYGNIAGMITTTDLFAAMKGIVNATFGSKNLLSQGKLVASTIMTRDVLTFREDKTLYDLIGSSIHNFPIVRDGKLVGTIGIRDVFKQFYAVLAMIDNMVV